MRKRESGADFAGVMALLLLYLCRGTTTGRSTMRQFSPRIPPILPAAFTAQQKQLAGGWDTLNFTRVIVQHPELYGAFIPFLDKLIRGSNLPPRDREVLIIRVLAVCEEV